MSEPIMGVPGIGEAAAPEAAASPETTSAFGALVSGLDPQLAQNPSITKHDNLGSMAKEYVNLVSAVGRKGVILPAEDNQEDRNRFYKEIGRPDDPGQYDFGDYTPPADMPWDDNLGAHMVAKMWEMGLTQDQVPEIVAEFTNIQRGAWNARESASAEANGKTISTLQSELGNAYEERMNLTHRAVQHLFDGEDTEQLLNTRLESGVALGDYMPFVRAMMKASEGLREDELVDDRTKGLPGAKTPDEAQKELDTLMADKEFRNAYFNTQDPNHVMALAKAEELYAYKGKTGAIANVGIGQHGVGVTPNRE